MYTSKNNRNNGMTVHLCVLNAHTIAQCFTSFQPNYNSHDGRICLHITRSRDRVLFADLIVCVKPDSVDVYCNPVNYAFLLAYIASWPNLHVYCLSQSQVCSSNIIPKCVWCNYIPVWYLLAFTALS